MNRALRELLAECLGAECSSLSSVSGGDIGASYEVRLPDGRRCFVKDYGDAAPGIAEREASGLAWLAAAKALRTPRVVATHGPSPSILVLEWIDEGRPARDHDDALGRGLASLHAARPDGFGLAEDNYIGRLPQQNQPCEDWASFYAERRIAPQIQLARESGRIPAELERRAAALIARMPELCGPPEPPARLHGDLWGGNCIVDEAGHPCLIDPATYGGHREVDLAMMRLFGGFSQRVFDAYNEALPLAPGWRARIPLYQLYPLLVHVNLFGGSYTASVERALGHY